MVIAASVYYDARRAAMRSQERAGRRTSNNPGATIGKMEEPGNGWHGMAGKPRLAGNSFHGG